MKKASCEEKRNKKYRKINKFVENKQSKRVWSFCGFDKVVELFNKPVGTLFLPFRSNTRGWRVHGCCGVAPTRMWANLKWPAGTLSTVYRSYVTGIVVAFNWKLDKKRRAASGTEAECVGKEGEKGSREEGRGRERINENSGKIIFWPPPMKKPSRDLSLPTGDRRPSLCIPTFTRHCNSTTGPHDPTPPSKPSKVTPKLGHPLHYHNLYLFLIYAVIQL